jgi:hypothetical protein
MIQHGFASRIIAAHLNIARADQTVDVSPVILNNFD